MLRPRWLLTTFRPAPRHLITEQARGSPPAGTSAGLVLLLPPEHPAFTRQPGDSDQFGDLPSLALAKVGTPKSHNWDKDLDASGRVSQGRRENNLSIDHQGHCLWHWVKGWILGSRWMPPLVVWGGGLFMHQLSLVVGCLGSLTSLRFWAVLTCSQVGCRGFGDGPRQKVQDHGRYCCVIWTHRETSPAAVAEIRGGPWDTKKLLLCPVWLSCLSHDLDSGAFHLVK